MRQRFLALLVCMVLLLALPRSTQAAGISSYFGIGSVATGDFAGAFQFPEFYSSFATQPWTPFVIPFGSSDGYYFGINYWTSTPDSEFKIFLSDDSNYFGSIFAVSATPVPWTDVIDMARTATDEVQYTLNPISGGTAYGILRPEAGHVWTDDLTFTVYGCDYVPPGEGGIVARVCVGFHGNLRVSDPPTLEPVPEPASLLLLGTGLVGAVRAARKRKA